MTLQEAAEHLQTTKKRLWRAVKGGQLEAVQVQKGHRWEYRVTPEALEAYRQILDTEENAWSDAERVVPTGTTRSVTFRNESEHFVPTDRERPGTWNQVERPTWNDLEPPSPPAEVYIALIDRLSRAERRSVELELQLRQSQRLLTENAESITEKEALAREAQAQLQVVEDAKQVEIERLAAELELTRSQLVEATQKSSGWFSWLGLRKKRTTTVSIDKAV